MDITTNNRTNLNHYSDYCNSIDNIDIVHVHQIRDLGVIVDSKLKFTPNIL